MVVDLGQVIAIGGPTSAITAVFVVLINAWLSTRKDQREQQAADVQTVQGNLTTVSNLYQLINAQEERWSTEKNILTELLDKAQENNRRLEQHINSQDDTIARQQRQIEWLTEDLGRAQAAIAEMRQQRP